MPPVKSSSGLSPGSANGAAKSGGSAHRVGRESPGFTGGSANASGMPTEASLASQDVIRQLLSLAQGDLSSVTARPSAEASASAAGEGSTHPSTVAAATSAPSKPAKSGTVSPTTTNTPNTATTTTTTTANGDAGSRGTGQRASQVHARGSDAAASPALFVVPRPVPVLRPPVADGAAASLSKSDVDSAEPSSAAAMCVSTPAEVCAFYLTALVAHALHMEDYWLDLRHQIEVDQHVDFIYYCAEHNFGVLKTMHLLQWWQQYRQLVREENAVHAVQLSDGNPQAPAAVAAGGEEAPPAVGSAAADGHSGAQSGKETGSASKGSAKKGRRASATATTGEFDTASATSATAAAAMNALGNSANTAAVGGSAAPAVVYATHAEAVQAELRRFVEWELAHEYDWRLVPREPLFSTSSGLLSPLASNGGTGAGSRGASNINNGGSGTGATAAAAGGASAGGGGGAPSAGKSSKADKAKMQQQQQQELEMEEQRLARIAALPPDNIFLTKDEVADFVRRVVTEDLCAHAALHVYVAAHDQQPTCALTHAAATPAFFSVQVEAPMPVPPLRESTRVSAVAAAGTPTRSPRLSGDAPDGAAAAARTVTTPVPTRPASSVQSKPRSRGNSKNPNNTNTTAATTTTTAAGATAAGEAAGADEMASTVQLRPAPPSAMELLRAEQAAEAAAFRAAHAEATAQATAQAQATQHAADVNLFFAKASTQTAVQAVYASMEDTVAARQHRILQRVTALEVALGLAESPAATGEGEAATAGQ